MTIAFRTTSTGLMLAAPDVALLTAIAPGTAWAEDTCSDGWRTIQNGQCDAAGNEPGVCQSGLVPAPSGECVALGDNSAGLIPGFSAGGQPPLPAEMMPRPYDPYCDYPGCWCG